MATALDDFIRTGLVRYGQRLGAQPGSRPASEGTAQFENQIDTQFLPRLQRAIDAGRSARNIGILGLPSSIKALTPASAAPAPGENEFQQRLARLSKNPRFDALTDRFLTELEQFAPNRSLVRGAAQDQLGRSADLGARTSAVTGRSLDTLQADQDVNRNLLDNFLQRYNASVPQLDASTAAQTRTLDRIFAESSDPDSLAARQAGIRSRARAAETDAILPQVERAVLASQARAGITGVNRINDLNLRNTALQLARDNAVRNAEREARDLAALTELQRATAGLPQDITTTNILRSRIPLDARLDLASRELGLSGQALQQALSGEAQSTANLASGLALDRAADPLTDLARRQAISGEAQRQFLLNNFLEVAQRGQVPQIGVPPYYPSPTQFAPGGDIPMDDYSLPGLEDLFANEGTIPLRGPARGAVSQPMSSAYEDFYENPERYGGATSLEDFYENPESNPLIPRRTFGTGDPLRDFYENPELFGGARSLEDYYENPELYAY